MSELRPASFGDLREVVRWIGSAQQARHWAGPRLTYPIDPQKLRQEIQWAEASSFCLKNERRLIGYGQIVPKPNNRLHLARLIVRPAYRGQGWGRRLAISLLDEALGRAPSAVTLNAFPDNKPAVELYQQIGFVAAERMPDTPGSDALTMTYPNRRSAPQKTIDCGPDSRSLLFVERIKKRRHVRRVAAIQPKNAVQLDGQF